jgi:hypothetical protein
MWSLKLIVIIHHRLIAHISKAKILKTIRKRSREGSWRIFLMSEVIPSRSRSIIKRAYARMTLKGKTTRIAFVAWSSLRTTTAAFFLMQLPYLIYHNAHLQIIMGH